MVENLSPEFDEQKNIEGGGVEHLDSDTESKENVIEEDKTETINKTTPSEEKQKDAQNKEETEDKETPKEEAPQALEKSDVDEAEQTTEVSDEAEETKQTEAQPKEDDGMELLAGELPTSPEDETNAEDFEKLIEEYGSNLGDFEEGELIKGKIIGKNDSEVIVDVGFKSEGTIPISEFRQPDQIKVGDEIEVFLEKIENQDGLVVLSKKRADFVKVWNQVKEFYESAASEDKKLVIYPGMYHEIFNEIEKEKVFNDVLDWLNSHI